MEYINREGSFAHDELWKETNKFSDNFISTAQTPNALNGLNALLYKTDNFGSIKNSQRGPEVMEEQSALSHVEYINREKAFANRGVCIFQSHHLPKWANDAPKTFFQAADEYEAVGNRRYREIEFALPNELKTVEKYRQIIDAFIAKHLSDHYFAYAIHNKIGVMSDGQHPLHVHIMFSERLIDDVEKKSTKERLKISFSIRHERKKTAPNRPSTKNGNVVRPKLVNGRTKIFYLSFAQTLPRFKMKFWRCRCHSFRPASSAIGRSLQREQS